MPGRPARGILPIDGFLIESPGDLACTEFFRRALHDLDAATGSALQITLAGDPMWSGDCYVATERMPESERTLLSNEFRERASRLGSREAAVTRIYYEGRIDRGIQVAATPLVRFERAGCDPVALRIPHVLLDTGVGRRALLAALLEGLSEDAIVRAIGGPASPEAAWHRFGEHIAGLESLLTNLPGARAGRRDPRGDTESRGHRDGRVRVRVCMESLVVFMDGTAHDGPLTPTQASFLRKVVAANGGYCAPDTRGVRRHQLVRKLPRILRDMLHSKRGAGYALDTTRYISDQK